MLHIMLHEAYYTFIILYIYCICLMYDFMSMTIHMAAKLICMDVGTGIALGGGLGIGANLWGASVDSVLGIDVISTWQNNSADWDIVRINSTNYPNLFWGMLVSLTWACFDAAYYMTDQ